LPRKIVPPHYHAVLIYRRTHEQAGFLSHTVYSRRGVNTRIVRLVPNRAFSLTGQAEIETHTGQYARLPFGLKFKYEHPDTFYFNFPGPFRQSHAEVKRQLLLCIKEGLCTSVRGRTYEELRSIGAQELAQEVLERSHLEPDGKSLRAARQ